MTLYNLRTTETGYRITKFDSDLNISSSYNVSMIACECPQGHKPTCRHRKMLPLMLDRVDTAWFWHYDEAVWKDPTGEAKAIREAELEDLTEKFHTARDEAFVREAPIISAPIVEPISIPTQAVVDVPPSGITRR